MTGPHAVVLHRPVTRSARGTLASFARGIGTHFVVDLDGTTIQAASLNTTGFPASPLAKALAFTMAVAACQSTSLRASSDTHLQMDVVHLSSVLRDDTASYVGTATTCDGWRMDPQQAEEFFRLSRPVDTATYHHHYDTAPCKVVGSALIDGQLRRFEINGAAKAKWNDGSAWHYVGCEVAACEPLVMWMPSRVDI